MMCDGLGWFTPLDFKRTLLVFEKIEYLLPKETVAFRDIDGIERWLIFPQWLYKSRAFSIEHSSVDVDLSARVAQCALADAQDVAFRAAVAEVPASDRLYAWRVASSDATFSPILVDLPRDDGEVVAHALLLNRFLVSADLSGQMPISGRSHIRRLLATKLATAPSASGLRPATTAKVQPISLALVEAFVADDDLDQATEAQICAYKEANSELFRQFTSEVIQISNAIKELPLDQQFEAALKELQMTDLWRRRNDIAADLRDAWTSFFKTAAKGTAAALLGLGVIPGMPLSAIALTAASASATWAIPDLIELLARRRKVRRHGMYYLMNFG
jgi:hypothetical protein